VFCLRCFRLEEAYFKSNKAGKQLRLPSNFSIAPSCVILTCDQKSFTTVAPQCVPQAAPTNGTRVKDRRANAYRELSRGIKPGYLHSAKLLTKCVCCHSHKHCVSVLPASHRRRRLEVYVHQVPFLPLSTFNRSILTL
jgi:hypothetical protein